MKLLLVCLCAMFSLAFGNVLEFKRIAETESKDRFETIGLGSNDETEDKRGVPHEEYGLDTCQSGYVESKYCTTSAKNCYGSNGQNKYVTFKTAFKAPPKVMIGLTLVDSNKDQNVRVRVSADSITKKGFNIKFKPWNSSITYQMGVNWMACP